MIVKALKKVLTDQAVMGMVVSDVKVPIQLVVGANLNALEIGQVDMDCLNVPMHLRHDSVPWIPMRLDTMPAQYFGKPGLIVGRNSGVALEYLVEHWVCGQNENIDPAVKAAREARAKGEPFLHLVQRFAVSESGRRHWDVEDESSEAFVWTKEQFRCSFDPIHDTLRGVYTADRGMFDGEKMQAIVVARTIVVGGHKLCGWDMMVMPDDKDSGAVVVSSESGWQAGPFRRLDPALIQRFDQHGRLVAITQADMTVWQNWVARILVKVPRSTGAMGSEIDPSCLADIPVGKLVDARLPVSIARDVQVVADPAVARDILCRSSRGYVIPGLGADVLPPSFKKLAGRWLALCVPVQWIGASGGIGPEPPGPVSADLISAA
ncbi:MAG TPA: hypothetical protein PLB35_04865 [Myxococcota bacterium]|nr:hypothetical protein [Myxococcota bacterium]HOA12861.1 hypothetical protein [Myxococcota bacterium]HOH76565.1 hypothetical protein [Myxococcota bacterium]HPV05253.1 hypothetical protein [Myxococcota bacterium]